MTTPMLRSRTASLTLATLAALLLCAPSASAQRSDTKGLFLQLTLDAQSLNYNEDDFSETDDGGGLGLRAGWGVSRLVTLYLGAAGARIDGETNGVINEEYDWAGGELGVRLNFRSGRTVVPYLDVALRGVTAREDDIDLEFRGGGATLGGGIAVFLSPSVALDAGLRVGGGGFDEVQLGRLSADIDEDDFGYGEGRFSVGLTLYPLR